MVVNDVASDRRVNPEVMERFGITAMIAVPLIMRGEVFGVLIADRFGVPALFTEQQLDFLQKAAATLSLALENARLYETERTIADRLQEALLTMPVELPGIQFAHAYHAPTANARVGGDFYDLFELDDHRVGLVIGDVAGKGLDAAVLTSLVKNAIRAYAHEADRTPAHVLRLANDVVFRSTPPAAFVTVFFGILDRRDGTLIYGNAGHTTGAVVRADRSVATLPSTGPLLGAFDDMTFGEAKAHLEPDELLFLYTDGLTEARRDREQYGEHRLLAFLSRDVRSAPRVVDEAIEDVMGFAENVLRDDLAILAIRRSGCGAQGLAQ